MLSVRSPGPDLVNRTGPASHVSRGPNPVSSEVDAPRSLPQSRPDALDPLDLAEGLRKLSLAGTSSNAVSRSSTDEAARSAVFSHPLTFGLSKLPTLFPSRKSVATSSVRQKKRALTSTSSPLPLSFGSKI